MFKALVTTRLKYFLYSFMAGRNKKQARTMGAGMIGKNLAERIADTFLATEFEGGRHERRVNLITDMER